MKIQRLLTYLFFLLVAVLVVLPGLQQGMFLDGINYANVANNLANGKGTLWHFTYSDTFLQHYTHQLPFMLWCEAFMFYLFGDSLLVERIFCLLLLILNAFAMDKLWKVSFPNYSAYQSLLLVLWIITPVVYWGFINNVQEIMMSLCGILSITNLLTYFKEGQKRYLLLGGLFCFLCGFCKGIQGLFPLAAILFYHLTIERRKLRNLILDQVWFSLPTAFFSTLLWIYEPSRRMLVSNFNDRLKSTFVTDIQNTTGFRFNLWFDLLMELLVTLGLCIFIYLLFRICGRSIKLNWQKHSLFFVLIGLSASLPLIVTLEQRRFYLISCIPFFTIAMSGIIVPFLEQLKVKQNVYQRLSSVILLATACTLVFTSLNYDSYKRDESLLADVNAIGNFVSNKTISADPELMFEYSLLAYLARIHNVSLDFDGKGRYDYHLTRNLDSNKTYQYSGNQYHMQVYDPEK